MSQRLGARMVLAGCCLFLLKLTGCPGPQRPPTTTPVTPSATQPLPSATTPTSSLPPEPPAPVGVSAKDQCPLAAAGSTCYVTHSDDGMTPPTAHPCQYPQVGKCDSGGQPTCLFQWKVDGEPCNNNLGTCQNRRCRCTSERSCGYDCSQTCEANSACQQGVCVATFQPIDNRPQTCGGCAHRNC